MIPTEKLFFDIKSSLLTVMSVKLPPTAGQSEEHVGLTTLESSVPDHESHITCEVRLTSEMAATKTLNRLNRLPRYRYGQSSMSIPLPNINNFAEFQRQQYTSEEDPTIKERAKINPGITSYPYYELL